ncbi:30S ribosomal protein S1 [Furfurilactobacillus milii]|uniref:30S ribosomal protein S1 n=2 Tax=Furfurilactobacillus TaxID=2767882 RepID=A0ABT6D9G5_9LACO|nr:30S ribosomal protein S1 [Furfurilactobacillus milii]QLE66512.1 SSU ribosomal protein S1p [Furfurilactobacillus rossiae]MCF6159965.1 30S ribosomal protein S1 [Furfurilactobacillus milii]MCF6162486.1 30S ribosomal protein S1 [Furfurilactobacillus milii]MDF9912927.1 30S ribosomal protein S1 [Furfurilactobacillus milii]QLE68942.1 SSU ribosomal protein S1p [Furfurilactobacillus rossiae]
MSESEDNKELLDALNNAGQVNIGDVVKGEVLAIDEDRQAIVGIGDTGVEGVVPVKELTSDSDSLKVGNVLDLVVISRIGNDKEGGSYLLSQRRLEARKAWDNIEKEYQSGDNLDATVTQVVKGGLVVDAGVRGFVPASMVSDHYVEDLNQFKGQKLTFKIVEIEPSENRLILSHRAIVEAENKAKREELFATLVAGDVVEGTVARMTDFGAFVDLGGVDGLVHVSEISYEHVNKPSDVLKVGQQIKVKVLNVDPDRQRISLSLKQTQPGPWDDIEERAPVGAVLDGTVRRLTDFGAFVEVFSGVEGLVHISQISHEHIATPNDVLKVGQDVKVKVLNVDPEQQRLGLSIKALEEKPASENNHEEHEDRGASRNDVQNYSSDDDGGFTIGDLTGNDLNK